MSFLLLVWNCAALIAAGAVFLAVADRILAIRDVMDPLCGLKVVNWLIELGLAAWVLKAVRTWPYMQACRSVAGRNMDAIVGSSASWQCLQQ